MSIEVFSGNQPIKEIQSNTAIVMHEKRNGNIFIRIAEYGELEDEIIWLDKNTAIKVAKHILKELE